ncbi:MAG TPA: M20/M25/M40 family metallo-hydrolase [Candidatus Aminicenantes bacterium]|nr:M20/M25/M40 family metallo-hydrolase [Candidatus Aminicenantes bacterium]
MTKRSLLTVLALLTAAGAAGAQSKAWDLLRELVRVPGVSGHEGRVADVILDRLPAGLETERDAMNNIWFTVGSGRPHLLFVAHTDELGWIVDQVTADGRVRVKPGGGLLAQTVEARPVLIHTARGDVPGIVSPRPGYDDPPPEVETPAAAFTAASFEIYLGVETEAGARALGVAEGDPVSPSKTLSDLGPGLMATRAVDDRAGCAALLEAARRLSPGSIKGRTITFAWDVQEEIGLFGASELAKSIKPDFVFAVDTFVSADSPLESKRLASLPIGRGAVVRAIDSSSITPKTEIRKVLAIAKRRGIPVQVGNTRGGNDGSVFVAGGAVNIPLSWPGTYAHSLIEKIDRRDLEALTDLVLALVTEWK